MKFKTLKFKKIDNRVKKILLTAIGICFVVFFVFSATTAFRLRRIYFNQFGGTVYDRNHDVVYINPNSHDELATQITEVPTTLRNELLQQEDQQFMYHPGFNPVRWVAGIFSKTFRNKGYAVSTISEQLTKNLLRSNSHRTLLNKFIELSGSVSLEIFFSKNEILKMYVNSVPMGKNIIGMETASWYYFNTPINKLNEDQIRVLVDTIPSPTKRNPSRISDPDSLYKVSINTELTENKNIELLGYCTENADCETTIDTKLTSAIRNSAKNVTTELWEKRGRNAAVVVLDNVNKSVLALVGTPEPGLNGHGYQIDMTRQYRPIGSTVKPFMYGLAFDKGAMPETKVSDSEEKLYLKNDFAFYPQNYDGKWRGDVTLEMSLAQSLNVPSLKVLEFIQPTYFFNWLEQTAKVELLQPPESYGLSSAMGGLEMTPQSLAFIYSLFSNRGSIAPFTLKAGEVWQPVGIKEVSSQELMTADAVARINKILSNRLLGVEQFGLESNLNLPFNNYALKTGTSYEYHDSWVVGYTPEVTVVVWIGNAENEPLYELSGQSGAGELWQLVMNELYNRGYIQDTPFKYDDIDHTKVPSIQKLEEATSYISPMQGDKLRIKNGSSIHLQARQPGQWYIDGVLVGTGMEMRWAPKQEKKYKIYQTSAGTEYITVQVTFE